jgi:hypothetical protein
MAQEFSCRHLCNLLADCSTQEDVLFTQARHRRQFRRRESCVSRKTRNAMPLYEPPASIDDFSRRPALANALRTGWDAQIKGFIAETKDQTDPTLTVSGLFFDQLADPSGIPDPAPVGVPWNAFPQILTNWFATQPVANQERLANEWAEKPITTDTLFGFYRKDSSNQYVPIPITYRRQDEYCEWHVERNGSQIQRIYFTCEPPEYWSFLAEKDITLVLDLYRELLHNSAIQKEEICWPYDVYSEADRQGHRSLMFSQGSYNRWNDWNTTKGAVHLTHWANSLDAEVRLASDGSLRWPQPAGAVDPHRLICCAAFGGVNRSSDPKIGSAVFSLAAQGLSVALANPVGLYMQRFQLIGLRDPQGAAIANALTLVRHSPDGQNILRAEVALPANGSYTLDQCTLNNERLQYGGQIVRSITMSLFAVAKRIPNASATAISTCPATCCPYPTNGQFFGTFKNDGHNCSQRSSAEWSRNLRDLADIDTHPLIARALLLDKHAQQMKSAPVPVRIRGRSLQL